MNRTISKFRPSTKFNIIISDAFKAYPNCRFNSRYNRIIADKDVYDQKFVFIRLSGPPGHYMIFMTRYIENGYILLEILLFMFLRVYQILIYLNQNVSKVEKLVRLINFCFLQLMF